MLSVALVMLSAAPLERLPAMELYRKGRIVEADQASQAELAEAQKHPDAQLWDALMARAWLEECTGQHVNAIEHSQQALELAHAAHDDFREGRSLDWLGMSYASMGLYSAAEQFLLRAVELGAPGGKVKLVAVWGLGQQELGFLYFRRGEVAKAKAALQATYTYAKEHGIDVGVAEGGAHLSEIAAHEGAGARALALADEALAAAHACDCSRLNTARALTARARALALQAKADPKLRAAATTAAEKARDDAEASLIPRYRAEALLVLAEQLPDERLDRKLQLTSQALELLVTSSNELWGRAEMQMAALFLEDKKPRLAELYLTHGIKVDEAMLRKVDSAYAAAQLANLDEALGKKGERLAKLADAIDAAKRISSLPAELDAQEKLGHALAAQGYVRLARAQLRDAIDTLHHLLELDATPAQKATWRAQELKLAQEAAALSLRLQPSPTPE